MNRLFQRGTAVCLLLCMVAVMFAGCGRRATSRKQANVPRRKSGTSSISAETRSVVTNPPPTPTPAPEPAPAPTEAPGSVNPSKKEPLIYTDDRVPQYSGANPQWEQLRFEWVTQDGAGSAWMTLNLDVEMYRYYRNLGRYMGVENLPKYINEANNQKVVQNVVAALRDVAEDLHYNDAAVAREIAKFVQDCIEYQYDSDTTGEDEYPRYPIETIYERQGDCEDTSILMAALLKEWGYEVGFLHLPGHIAVALRTADNYSSGDYYEINGHRYLYIESTGSGWNIGDIPDDCKGVGAQFYPIP